MKNVPPGHQYFHGEYHGGKATTTYIPDGNDMIFDGKFAYRKDFGGGLYELAKGSFDHNLKVGDWYFERKGSNNLKQLMVHFTGGHIDGNLECSYQERGINSVTQSTVSMLINKEKPCLKLVGKLKGGNLTGYCDDEGRPDGKWILTFEDADLSDVQQVEVWEHGKLVEAYELDTERNERKDQNVLLCQRVSYLLDIVCSELLAMVRRGTKTAAVRLETTAAG